MRTRPLLVPKCRDQDRLPLRLFSLSPPGAVLSSTYIPAADFTPHHDLNDLGVYLWNEKVLSNYFCKFCGIFTCIGDGHLDAANTKAIGVALVPVVKKILGI